jgi:hypothetical protein
MPVLHSFSSVHYFKIVYIVSETITVIFEKCTDLTAEQLNTR